MTAMHEVRTTDQIAAQWAVRNLRGLSADERNELLSWQAADPRHLGSYLRACAIERLTRSLTEEDLAAEEGIPDEAHDAPPRTFGRRRVVGMALAASLVAAIGIGLFPRGIVDRKISPLGQVSKIALTDGSEAVLGSDTRIAVAMTQQRRSVELEAGRAWFHVAHNPARPFEVRHGDIVVRATGTAFQVRALERGLEVIVTEGSVAVFHDGAPPLAILRAGGRFTYATGVTRQEQLSSAAISEQTAWRDGLIVLNGQRVADAVAEINRYNRVQIRIADPNLAGRRTYGTFQVHDPEHFARALGIALEARVKLADGRIDLGGEP